MWRRICTVRHINGGEPHRKRKRKKEMLFTLLVRHWKHRCSVGWGPTLVHHTLIAFLIQSILIQATYLPTYLVTRRTSSSLRHAYLCLDWSTRPCSWSRIIPPLGPSLKYFYFNIPETEGDYITTSCGNDDDSYFSTLPERCMFVKVRSALFPTVPLFQTPRSRNSLTHFLKCVSNP